MSQKSQRSKGTPGNEALGCGKVQTRAGEQGKKSKGEVRPGEQSREEAELA